MIEVESLPAASFLVRALGDHCDLVVGELLELQPVFSKRHAESRRATLHLHIGYPLRGRLAFGAFAFSFESRISYNAQCPRNVHTLLSCRPLS